MRKNIAKYMKDTVIGRVIKYLVGLSCRLVAAKGIILFFIASCIFSFKCYGTRNVFMDLDRAKKELSNEYKILIPLSPTKHQPSSTRYSITLPIIIYFIYLAIFLRIFLL